MTRIQGYRFGHVVVDGEEQTRDAIVLPSRVVRDWRRTESRYAEFDPSRAAAPLHLTC